MIHWCIFSSGVTSNFGSPARKSCKALSPLLPPSLLHIPSPFALTFCPLPFCPLLFPLRALFLQLGPFSASRRSGVCYELPQCFVGQNPGRKCILEHFVTSETTSGDIKFCVFAKKINSIIFDPQDRQHYFVLPWTGFSTDAQSPWVSKLVLLALQIKRSMPMMVFVHRLPGPMRLAVDTRAGGHLHNSPHWKRRPGRPRHTWVRQVENDIDISDISADVAWDIAMDRCSWRALRPQLGDAENVRNENTRHEKAAPYCVAWKYETWKCGTKNKGWKWKK